MIRSTFKRRAFPTVNQKPDRSDEFASWTPRPRPVAPSVQPLVSLEPGPAAEAVAPSTPAARRHMGRIKAMRCVCCRLLGRQQQQITDVHHIREGRQARSDWLTLPLCWDCHQGPNGVHGDKTYLRQLQMREFDLLAVTLEQLEATA